MKMHITASLVSELVCRRRRRWRRDRAAAAAAAVLVEVVIAAAAAGAVAGRSITSCHVFIATRGKVVG